MKRIILAAGTTVLLAIIGLISLPRHTAAQATYSTPVKVVNTGASQAVPVAVEGTTPVSGTVTIGNSSIPVTISNGAGQNVPVTVSVTPWDWYSSCSIGASSPPPTGCNLSTTAVQGSIIQTISCHGEFPPGDTAWVAMTYKSYTDPVDIQFREVEFPLQRVGLSVDAGLDEYSGVQNVSVPALSAFRLHVAHSSTQASGTVYCTVSGFQY